MNRPILFLTVTAVLCTLFSSCGAPQPQETEAPGTEATTEATRLSAPDQSVNSLFALPYCYGENGVFNPILTHSEICDPLFSLLYDGLFAVDGEGNAVPRLARSASREELTLTVTLREDACFHDGTPVTPEDAVWSLKLAKDDPDSAFARRLSSVTEISAGQGNEVVLTLSREHGSLTHCLDIPIVKKGTGITSNAVGSGRYRIVEQDGSMYLMANEEWYDIPEGGEFPTDLIILTYVDGLDDMVYSMVSGNSNLVRLDPFIFRDRKIGGNCDAYPVLSRDFLYIAFNTSYYAPTGDSGMRKALAAAIDVGELLSSAYAGTVYSGGLFPASVTLTEPGEPPRGDAAAAARALREEGYRYIGGQWLDGEDEPLELTLVCGRDSAKQAAAELIYEDLKKAGIECTLKISDNVAADVANGNFDIAVCETCPSPDFDFSYLLAYEGSENFNGFVVPGLDGLLSDFAKTGHAGGAELASEINSVLWESLPIIPIGYKQDTVCVSREFAFGNIVVSESDPFVNLFDWVSYR